MLGYRWIFTDDIIYICTCLRWHMCLQSAKCLIGRIMSLPKTSWPGLLFLILWYVNCTVEAAVAGITIHESDSSTYVTCRLYARTKIPYTWWILYMIVFACGFPVEAIFDFILYSSSIRVCLNSWMMYYDPFSYVM